MSEYKKSFYHKIESINSFEEVGKLDQNISITHIDTIVEKGGSIYTFGNSITAVENGLLKYKALSPEYIGGTVFIEVENPLDESIFNLLFEKYPHVLFNPSIEEHYKYAGNITIVVQKLISEAPPSLGEYRQVSLEKLLVDLFVRGISGKLISRSEYHAIYEDSFKKYNINLAKMFRYARRRGNKQIIIDYICNKTNIKLENIK